MPVLRRRVGLKQRMVMAQALSLNDMEGVVRLQRTVLVGSFSVEGIGAAILTVYFWPRFGFSRALWLSVCSWLLSSLYQSLFWQTLFSYLPC